MKLLVTGAAGFLGQHVVQAAIGRGHHVRALVRPTSDVTALQRAIVRRDGERFSLVRHDLRQSRGLVEAVRHVDAVLHLAAAKTGSFYTQMAGTVVATENLLAAMHEAGVSRLVLVSTFSVYDYLALPSQAMLDETAPLEADPEQRDDYCRTKLLQERLAREAEAAKGIRLTVLRPGVIYAQPHALWTDRLGVRFGQTWLAVGSRARLPLTHVSNCARAVVQAGECEAAIGHTINVVDDDLPTQRQYRNALRRNTHPRPRVLPINWTMMRLGVWGLDVINRRLLGGQGRWPAIFRRRALHARCRPLRYTNQKARDLIGWVPAIHWRDAIAAAPAAEAMSDATGRVTTASTTPADTVSSRIRSESSCVSHT